MGASSTGYGMTCGRGGSDMEPWTGVSLGILRRVDRDEDLAPRVLVIAVSEGGRRWARLAQAERADRGVLWLGSS